MLNTSSPVAEPELLNTSSPVAEPELLNTSTPVAESELLNTSSPVAEPELLNTSSPVVEPELLNTSSPVAEPELLNTLPTPEADFVCTSIPRPEPKSLCTPLPISQPESLHISSQRSEPKLLHTSSTRPELEPLHTSSPGAEPELLRTSLLGLELKYMHTSLPTLDPETLHGSSVGIRDKDATPLCLKMPLNDSGTVVDESLEIVDTDDDIDDTSCDDVQDVVSSNASTRILEDTKESNASGRTVKNKKIKNRKPARPCFFCQIPQTRLKRHILKKHKNESQVIKLLSMNSKEQDRYISSFRKDGIKSHNLDTLKAGKSSFMRERRSSLNETEIPIMCAGCKGFYARKYKARHQLVCSLAGSNLMLPMVSIASYQHLDSFTNDFKELLNTLLLDKIGNYIKTDEVILMFGQRSFGALKRKKDKVTEAKKSVRARMRLTARVYLTFHEIYTTQTEVHFDDCLNNAADMYRREAITVLGRAINDISEKASDDKEIGSTSVCGQKSGLKVSILNLLKLTSKFLIGYFLVKNLDERAKKVTDFLQVLKLYEDELFGDAYYDLNYRRNVNLRKPVNLPKEDEISMLMEECKKIMNSIDVYDYPSQSFVDIRSATVTSLIIFNARRGGEPVRMQLYQWEEALHGEWVEKDDLPEDFDMDTILVTYQSGKGSDHLVPVIFPPETIKAMRYLTRQETRKYAGVHENNIYIFASTHKSLSHADGWHCINDMLKRICLKGAINATKNRHRIASILTKLQLPENEMQLIYKHFGHSERINQTVYQAPAGSLQLKSTARHLLQINSSKEPVSKNGNGKMTKYSETTVTRPVQHIETKKGDTELQIKSSKELVPKNGSCKMKKYNEATLTRPVQGIKTKKDEQRKTYPKRKNSKRELQKSTDKYSSEKIKALNGTAKKHKGKTNFQGKFKQ